MVIFLCWALEWMHSTRGHFFFVFVLKKSYLMEKEINAKISQILLYKWARVTDTNREARWKDKQSPVLIIPSLLWFLPSMTSKRSLHLPWITARIIFYCQPGYIKSLIILYALCTFKCNFSSLNLLLAKFVGLYLKIGFKQRKLTWLQGFHTGNLCRITTIWLPPSLLMTTCDGHEYQRHHQLIMPRTLLFW